MKKRLIFSNYDDRRNPYYGGGGSIAIHEVAKRLTSEYQVTVLTGSYPGAVSRTIDGVRYLRSGPSGAGPRVGQAIFQASLPHFVRKLRFDLWLENFTPPFSTACLQLFTDRPVVGLVHMLTAGEMQRKYKLPFRWFEAAGLRTYRNFIVLTENMKQNLMTLNPHARFGVIPNGTEVPGPMQSYRRRDHDYILFLGRLEFGQKGLDLLLQSLSVSLTEKTVNLKIAGSGPSADTARLHKMIDSLGLKPYVEILGRVSGQVKERLLQAASLVVIPSRSEAFSLTALEAVTYGIPVLSYDIPGLSWLDSGIAFKAKPFDYLDFAGLLTYLLRNPGKRAEISKREIALSRQYSWDEIARNYHSYIREII